MARSSVPVIEQTSGSSAHQFEHDVFISYSRHDRAFSELLEKTLEGYRPPSGLGLPARNLEIFRDESDFTGIDYYESIGKQLANSKKLIVLCSPHARASQYVNDEIQRFVQTRGVQNVIPLLVSGLPNNEAKLEQEGQRAFPQALMEAMEMPLAISYLGFNPARHILKSARLMGFMRLSR